MAASPAEAGAQALPEATEAKEKGKRGGVLRRVWRALFGGREDFEKRLQYLSKEEAAVHARMRRRTQFSRRTVRNLIVLSVLAEVCTCFPFSLPLLFFTPPDLRWSGDAAGFFTRLWLRRCSICYGGGEFAHSMRRCELLYTYDLSAAVH
jgi:hypothetical protein